MPSTREIIEPKNERLNVSRNFNLPHSPGIRAGDFIFLSGMLSTDPNTGERSPGTMAHETRQTLTNMRHLLESAGSSLERVVKLNVLLYDMLEFENMNAVFKQFFPVDPAGAHHVRRAALRGDEDRDRMHRARRLEQSPPRRRGPRLFSSTWVPACAGTTATRLMAALDLALDVLAGADRLVARLLARREAGRHAFDALVVVRVHEHADRQAPALGPAERRIHHPVQRRGPALVGPARHHVAEIDDELPGARPHGGPRAVGQAHLESAFRVGGGEDGHRAVVGMRAGAQLARQRRLLEHRIVMARHDAEVPVERAVEEALGQA